MTRKEFAKLIDVDVTTLRNWEIKKPKLIELLNLGLQVEKQIKQMEDDIKKLKELKENSNKGKLIL